MTLSQRQFAILNAMDILLWCDKSRAVEDVSTLKITPTENDSTKHEISGVRLKGENVKVSINDDKPAYDNSAIELQRLYEHPIFQDILLCLNATLADVIALPSSNSALNIKVKSLLWQLSSEKSITLHNEQLKTPKLAVLANTPAFKRMLWEKLSLLIR
jgi:DNA polymerase III psi subunit